MTAKKRPKKHTSKARSAAASSKSSSPQAAKAAPKKKAPAKTSRMSKQAELTHAEVSILGRMAGVEPETPRYRVLEAALAFKSSWVVLGEHLGDVQKSGAFKAWGYASFERYCADELFLSAATAKKLVRSWQWIDDEAPEYLPPRSADDLVERKASSSLPPGELPDLKSIAVLADAKKALKEARVSEDAYLALKRAALDGENASALKKALHESIPDEARPKKADDKVRHLRRALTACVKVIDELREWDAGGEAAGDELMVMAEALRDAVALRLPRAE